MRKLLAVFILISLSYSIVAKEKVTLITFFIPRYVESESEGEFIILAKKLAELSGVELEIKVYPTKRALQIFKNGGADGYFPALDVINPTNVHKTSDFYIKEDFIFELKTSDYTKLEKPKFCLTSGYPYTKKVLLNKKWNIMYAKSDLKCLELLKIGRAQAFVGEEYTALAALKTLRLSRKVKYKQYSPISTQNVYFAFTESDRGKILSQKFDLALKKIVMDGVYDSLFPEKKR